MVCRWHGHALDAATSEGDSEGYPSMGVGSNTGRPIGKGASRSRAGKVGTFADDRANTGQLHVVACRE
jgi:hypothetical protein